jgi:hypothetical protein
MDEFDRVEEVRIGRSGEKYSYDESKKAPLGAVNRLNIALAVMPKMNFTKHS